MIPFRISELFTKENKSSKTQQTSTTKTSSHIFSPTWLKVDYQASFSLVHGDSTNFNKRTCQLQSTRWNYTQSYVIPKASYKLEKWYQVRNSTIKHLHYILEQFILKNFELRSTLTLYYIDFNFYYLNKKQEKKISVDYL